MLVMVKCFTFLLPSLCFLTFELPPSPISWENSFLPHFQKLNYISSSLVWEFGW